MLSCQRDEVTSSPSNQLSIDCPQLNYTMIHKLINKISQSLMGRMFDFAEKGNKFLLKDFYLIQQMFSNWIQSERTHNTTNTWRRTVYKVRLMCYN